MATRKSTKSQPQPESPHTGQPSPQVPPELFSIKEVVETLVKMRGYNEGLYDISIEFSLAVGAVGPSPEQTLPGAIMGISRIGLQRATQMGPNTVDASSVNPAKPSSSKTKRTPPLSR